ncbi:MAG: hypothetical protein NXY59_01980 [Aigarchaeota archaeon]|nr:hypothetical protein [Candidatus Pelearchaeum maunauluense]
MVVKDKDAMLTEIRDTVNELKAQGLDEEDIEGSHEIHEIHEKYAEEDVAVEPGETKTFFLKFDAPGTYSYLCTELAATFPDTHADEGMVGKIVVE